MFGKLFHKNQSCLVKSLWAIYYWSFFFFFSEATEACLVFHFFFFIGAWEAFVKTFQQSVFFLSFSNPISVQISQQTQIPYFELCDVFCVFRVQIKLSLCPVLSPCLSKAAEGLRRSALWNTAKHWIRIQIRTTYWSDLMRKIWFVLFRLSRQKIKKKKRKGKVTQVFKSRPLLPAVWA